MTLREDANKLIRKIKNLKSESKAKDTGTVIVGYTAEYAMPVHENLVAFHKPGTQAKYLEQPYREMLNSGEMQTIIVKTTRQTKSVRKGMLVAGLRLQAKSQKIVPIDTGFLRSTAFTRVEGGSR